MYSTLLCTFLLPPPSNFAKTHTRLGRGRLGVGYRDLIPPLGYTRCAGGALQEDLLTMALDISQHRREEWCRPVDQRFLEALNRAKPDTLESFAAIWYRHNSEAGYYWEMLARHHYDQSRYHLLNLHAAFSLERPARTIEFRAFNGTLHAGKIKAYIQLCLAISAQALTTKAASPTRLVTDNPKYTFRCWLLRLGFIGDEFETARTHLLANLPGNAAWRQAS